MDSQGPGPKNRPKGKPCERCWREAVAGERFCLDHRHRLRREMKDSGYLEPEQNPQAAGEGDA